MSIFLFGKKKRERKMEVRDLMYKNIENMVQKFSLFNLAQTNSPNIFDIEKLILRLYNSGNYYNLAYLNNILQISQKKFYNNLTTNSEAMNTLERNRMANEDTAVDVWKELRRIKLINEFVNHNDLMQMYNNLKPAKTDYNYEKYMDEKLFSMYNEYYINDFTQQINDIKDFTNITHGVYRKSYFDDKYKSFFELISSFALENPIRDFSQKGIINILGNKYLRQKSLEILAPYTSYVEEYLYKALVRYMAKDYNITQILSLMLNYHITITRYNDLQKSIQEEQEQENKKREMEQERKRILSGDTESNRIEYLTSIKNECEKKLELMKLDLASVKNGADFEKYLYNIFEKIGYNVTNTKGSGDKGADLILSRNNVKHVVQAKFYSGTVGFDAIKEAHTGKDIYKAIKAAVVTNSTFTKQAIETATTLNVILIDGNKLQWLVDAVAQGKYIDIFM